MHLWGEHKCDQRDCDQCDLLHKRHLYYEDVVFVENVDYNLFKFDYCHFYYYLYM